MLDNACEPLAQPGLLFRELVVREPSVICVSSVEQVLEDPTAETRTLCSGGELAGCDEDEACVPAVAAAGLCIWREGMEPCPGPVYTQRTVVFQELVDERHCTPCACSSTFGPCLGGSIEFFDGADCGDGDPQPLNPGACDQFSASHVRLIGPAVTEVSCEPGTTEPAGGISGALPLTFCCASGP